MIENPGAVAGVLDAERPRDDDGGPTSGAVTLLTIGRPEAEAPVVAEPVSPADIAVPKHVTIPLRSVVVEPSREAAGARSFVSIVPDISMVLVLSPSGIDSTRMPTDRSVASIAPAAVPLGATPAAPASPQPPDAPSASAGIRPMTLAASEADGGPIAAGTDVTMGGVAAFSGGSGGNPGGGGPDDPHISGGWGDRHAADGDLVVPVGARMIFLAMAPPGKDIETYSWSGGTNYADYMDGNPVSDGDPDHRGPETMSVSTGVPSDEEAYTFIVDASPRSYTISLNVTYTQESGGGDGETTVRFSSARPPQAELSVFGMGMGEIWFRNGPPDDPGRVHIRYEGDGVSLAATTEVDQFGVQFMFMQLAHLNRILTNEHNNTFFLTNAGGGANLDDGLIGSNFPIGMLVIETETHSWVLPNPDNPNPNSGEYSMYDPVQVGTSKNYLGMTAHDSFSTYLMCKSSLGVWIALSRADWSFSGAELSPWPPDYLVNDAPPAPSFSSPVNGGEFPSWTARTSDLRLRQ